MKKRKIMLLLPCAALLLGGCSFQDVKNWVGNNIYFPVRNWVEDIFNPDGKKEEQEAKLTKIEVSGQFKQEYEQGEQFDPSGIVVTATYVDGSTKDVSNQATFSGFSSESLGTCTVTASYGGKSVEFEVTIIKAKTRSYSFSEVVAAYAANGMEVAIPDYLGADLNPTYVASGDYYVIKNSTHEEMDAFGESLIAAGWDLTVDNYGDYSGYFGNTVAFLYMGDYIDYSQYGGIIIQFTNPSSVFPAEEIAELFADYEAPDFGGLPEFEGESVYFQTSIYSESGFYAEGVRLDVYGASSSEFEDYLALLASNGWEDNNGLLTKAFADLGGIASVQYAQVDSRNIVFILYFGLSPIPTAGFPSEAIEDAFTQLQVPSFTITEPDGEGYTFEYSFDESNINYVSYPNYCYDALYINNMSLEQFNSYLEKCANDGWTVTAGTDGYTLTKLFGELQAKLALSHHVSEQYGNYATIIIYYVMQEPAKWPTDKAAQLVEKFAPGSETVIPACPDGTSYTVYMSTNYNEIDVMGADTLKDSYAAILRTESWEETEEGSYVFISPAQDIQITLVYTSSYGLEIHVAGYSAPVAEWPAADIKALLPNSSKDSVPEYSGEASGYSVLNDSYGTAVMVSVEEGTEDAAIATYIDDLAEAGYVFNEAFGVYVSPNAEIAIGAPYMGTSGSFTIPFEQCSIIYECPLAAINAFNETYGIGFQFPEAFGDFTNGVYYYPLMQGDGYVGTRLVFVGDQVETIQAAINAVIPSYYSWDDDMQCWYEETNYHEIDLHYANGLTTLSIWQ